MFGIFAVVIIKGAIINIIDSQKLKEYSQTEGVVVECLTEERVSTTGGGQTPERTHRYTVYISVVEYVVDGTNYTLKGPAYTSGESIGTKKTVFYNPANPAESLMKEDVSDTWYLLLVMVLIVTPAALLFRFVFKLFFDDAKDLKKERKQERRG